MSASAQAIAVLQALETVLRRDRGRLMAALTHRLGSFQRAEDALQEASLSALSHWARDGLPQSPQGWLIRVAFRKALAFERHKQVTRLQSAGVRVHACHRCCPIAHQARLGNALANKVQRLPQIHHAHVLAPRAVKAACACAMSSNGRRTPAVSW